MPDEATPGPESPDAKSYGQDDDDFEPETPVAEEAAAETAAIAAPAEAPAEEASEEAADAAAEEEAAAEAPAEAAEAPAAPADSAEAEAPAESADAPAEAAAPPAANADDSKLVEQVAERNKQLKAALMSEPELAPALVDPPTPKAGGGVKSTYLTQEDDDEYGVAAIAEPAAPPPRGSSSRRLADPEPPAPLQKQKTQPKRPPMLRQVCPLSPLLPHSPPPPPSPPLRHWQETAEAKAHKLERALREASAKLEALKARAAEVGADTDEWRSPREVVAEARKRRDAKRAALQKAQGRLALVSDERKKSMKHVERLVAASAARDVHGVDGSAEGEEMPEEPEALEKEIKAMRRQERQLQAAVPKLEETRFFLEKVKNERRDVERRTRELGLEVGALEAQLRSKAEQLEELKEAAQPSPITQHYEEETKRLPVHLAGYLDILRLAGAVLYGRCNFVRRLESVPVSCGPTVCLAFTRGLSTCSQLVCTLVTWSRPEI